MHKATNLCQNLFAVSQTYPLYAATTPLRAGDLSTRQSGREALHISAALPLLEPLATSRLVDSSSGGNASQCLKLIHFSEFKRMKQNSLNGFVTKIKYTTCWIYKLYTVHFCSLLDAVPDATGLELK